MAGTWVIVVAAGSGSRFGGAKQYEPLAGQRVLDRSLVAARSVADGVVLVVPPDRASEPEPAADVVASGGDTRSASVRSGLAEVPDDAELVLVHDAARPLASPDLWLRVVEALRRSDRPEAVVPVVPVTDTLRHRDGRTFDRSTVVAVQTPQGFQAAALRAAHAGGAEGTDDASLVEATGGRVMTVDGEPTNLKITTASDLTVAAALCR